MGADLGNNSRELQPLLQRHEEFTKCAGVRIYFGCPSVWCEYVLLSLINEKSDLANSQEEYRQAGNT